MKEGWLRRRYMWYFRRRMVKKFEESREGSCVRCGACCSGCLFYNEKGRFCRVYRHRPDICRAFPLTPEDIENVPTCGHSFRD